MCCFHPNSTKTANTVNIYLLRICSKAVKRFCQTCVVCELMKQFSCFILSLSSSDMIMQFCSVYIFLHKVHQLNQLVIRTTINQTLPKLCNWHINKYHKQILRALDFKYIITIIIQIMTITIIISDHRHHERTQEYCWPVTYLKS